MLRRRCHVAGVEGVQPSIRYPSVNCSIDMYSTLTQLDTIIPCYSLSFPQKLKTFRNTKVIWFSGVVCTAMTHNTYILYIVSTSDNPSLHIIELAWSMSGAIIKYGEHAFLHNAVCIRCVKCYCHFKLHQMMEKQNDGRLCRMSSEMPDDTGSSLKCQFSDFHRVLIRLKSHLSQESLISCYFHRSIK